VVVKSVEVDAVLDGLAFGYLMKGETWAGGGDVGG
jgi:hypothetical protein